MSDYTIDTAFLPNVTENADTFDPPEVKTEPCVGCPMREACKTDSLACLDFVTYVEGPQGWKHGTGRTPSKEAYRLIYKE